MEPISPVLVAVAIAVVVLCALLVVLGVRVFVAGRLARLQAAVDVHGTLLAGGAGHTAVGRLDALEARVREVEALCAASDARLAALERVTRAELPRVGFVRYNAFDDVGSDQSYALALVTAEGDGVVLTSIYSREETRTYGKAVTKFEPAVDASSEEAAAIARARPA